MQGTTQLPERAHEGRRPVRVSRHVRPHEHLAVGIRARADADRGDRQRLGEFGGDRGRHHFENDGECAGLFDGLGVATQGVCAVTATLHTRAAQGVFRLGRVTQVGAHGDARRDQASDDVGAALAALELDGVRAGLHEARGGGKGVLDRVFVGTEGKVCDDHRARG